MKILKWVFIVVLVIGAIIAIIPAFLASHLHCEQSMSIYAPAENAYYLVADFKNWQEWSPWHKMDPNWKLTFSGPDQGLGSSYSWKSDVDTVGSGKMTIIAASPADSLVATMNFEGMEDTSYCGYRFRRKGDSTVVTMTFDAEMSYFFRYMNGFMADYMADKFNKGLTAMKNVLENGPKKNPHEVIESWQNEMHYISVRDTCTPATVGPKYQQYFPALFGAAMQSGNPPAGPPFAIVHSDTAMTVMDIEWCVPVAKAAAAGAYKASTLPAGKMIKVEYYGPYEATGAAYGTMQQWLASKGKKIKGKCREVYITDPAGEKMKMDRVMTVIQMDTE